MLITIQKLLNYSQL